MREVHRILCPVDLSDVSSRVVDHAILLAHWYGAAITALHVCNPLVIPSADITLAGIVPPPMLTEEDVRNARERVAAWFSAAPASTVNIVVESGHPARRILELARALPADLIVVGTHGFGGFEHLVLGSVAEKVLRMATCPVMTVPPKDQGAPTFPFKKLLCPVDFSESSLAALETAQSLARQADAQLTILHVFDAGDEPLTDRPMTVPEYRRELERDLTVKLASLVTDGEHAGRQPRTRTIRGKAYREILAVAADERADLIVMGIHGRNAIDLMLFGSTTNQVVRRATCPVLTVRQ